MTGSSRQDPAQDNGRVGRPGIGQRERLEAEIREFFLQEEADWEEEDAMLGSDLWDTMPAVDSKAAARTARIFEKWLGKPLDVRLIRHGGYDDVEDMINHLVPAMLDRITSAERQEATP